MSEPAEPDGEPSPDRPDDALPNDESSIAPGSLRVAARVAEEMYGTVYTGIISHGPAAYGDHNTIVTVAAPLPQTANISKVSQVAEMLGYYADSAVDTDLDRAISRDPVVCLSGPRNSGRFTAACLALARRFGPDRIREIDLPSGAAPRSLVDNGTALEPSCGYVLRWPLDGAIDGVRSLAEMFRLHQASLVLICNRSDRDREFSGGEIIHRPPEPVHVLSRQIAYCLQEYPEAYVSAQIQACLQNDELMAELAATRGPGEVAALAERIAGIDASDPDAISSVLGDSQPRRRQRASAILLPSGSATLRRRYGQHERVFRVAYAVFSGRPLHYVYESAAWLLELVDETADRPPGGRMALTHAAADLLGDELKDDWAEGRDAEVSGESTRSAWIRDVGLRGAILDVAWHEFDGTRDVLLRWLNRLVREGDDTMMRAASETAGLLASLDFQRMHAALINEWASSRSPRIRQVAAWTEVVAYMSGQVDHRVRATVREWCYGSSNYRRDTAARVYASGLQQPVLAWSMADLCRIAADRLQRDEPAVAEAVAQLYRPETADWLIAELARWQQRAELRVHAARALMAMMDVPSQGRNPDLLIRLDSGNVVLDDLTPMWRLALVERSIADRAWSALVDWLRCADANPMLRETVLGLLSRITAGQHMRKRALHYLPQLWNRSGELPSWIQPAFREGDERR